MTGRPRPCLRTRSRARTTSRHAVGYDLVELVRENLGCERRRCVTMRARWPYIFPEASRAVDLFPVCFEMPETLTAAPHLVNREAPVTQLSSTPAYCRATLFPRGSHEDVGFPSRCGACALPSCCPVPALAPIPYGRRSDAESTRASSASGVSRRISATSTARPSAPARASLPM